MPNEFKLTWDGTGERYFQTGVQRGVVYPMTEEGTYPIGYAWNGLIEVDDNPDGGDTTDLWADNIKYASFRNPENNGGSIKAYTFPVEFLPCNGVKVVNGIAYYGQKRQPFGFCYRNEISNDAGAEDYVIILVYNSTISPTSKSHQTKNENPSAEEMSWDYKSTPVNVTGVTGVTTTSTIELDSRQLSEAKMAAIEAVLYGSGQTDARLPLPGEVASIINAVNG